MSDLRDQFEAMLREVVDKRPDQPTDGEGLEAAFRRLDEQTDYLRTHNPEGNPTC